MMKMKLVDKKKKTTEFLAVPGSATDILLGMMFKFTGTDPKSIDFSQPNWFESVTWTQQEQAKFVEQATDFLRTSGMSRLYVGKIVSRFILMYGWKAIYE